MRLLLVISLLMAGCAASSVPIPPQPNSPTSESVVAKVGQDIEERSNKVAAAVTVAREHADKNPEVVKAETGVALSFLPAPSAGELAIARQRVIAGADAKAYESAAEQGRKMLAKINGDLAKAKAEQAEAFRVSQLKDARIAELTAELERVKKDKDAQWWTMAGVAVVVAGAFASALASPKVGVPLLICGGAIGAFPYVVDSPWFDWIAGGFAIILAGLGVWVAYDAARDKVHESDEQAPPQV